MKSLSGAEEDAAGLVQSSAFDVFEAGRRVLERKRSHGDTVFAHKPKSLLVLAPVGARRTTSSGPATRRRRIFAPWCALVLGL